METQAILFQRKGSYVQIENASGMACIALSDICRVKGKTGQKINGPLSLPLDSFYAFFLLVQWFFFCVLDCNGSTINLGSFHGL